MFRVVLAFAIASAVSLSCSNSRAAPPIEAYGKLPAIDNVTLSPLGDRYALIAVDGDTRKLVVVTTDNQPLFAIKVGDAKVRRVAWAGNDHVLVTITSTRDLSLDFTTAKAEFGAVVSINVVTHKVVSVFSHHNQIFPDVEGEFGTAQVDGHWYGYFGGVTYGDSTLAENHNYDHNYADLYRVDLDSGDVKQVVEGNDKTSDWLVAPDGHAVARLMYDESTKTWSVWTDARAGRMLASGQFAFGAADLAGFGKTYDKIIMFDEQTRLWIGTTTSTDAQQVKLFDASAQAKMEGAFKAFPNVEATIDSWGPRFDRMVVFTTGPRESGAYWLVDIPNHSAKPLGYQYPDVEPEDVGPMKMVSWKAADGLTIHGVLTLPPGRAAKNLPVVVMPHGGPEERDYPVFDWWAQAFASQGYAVLQPNFRGSSGYGAEFIDAGHGEWGHKMQTDVSDGLAEIAKEGIVDPRRVCIVGASYGGYAALAGVTLQHGLYRCAVADAAVSDPASQLSYEYDKGASASPATRYWKTFMGAPSGYDEISPLRRAAKADAPILLIHGKDDIVVLYEQSVAMQKALQAAGKSVDLVTMANEDHWLSQKSTRVQMLTASVAFVEKYNPPDPAPPAAVAAVAAK